MIREAGYDGEYGVIRLFEEGELKRLTAGGLLFDAPVVKRKKEGGPPVARADDMPMSSPAEAGDPVRRSQAVMARRRPIPALGLLGRRSKPAPT